ncbi:MAG: hypothetical protein LBU73_02315 [Helicobacteraceae bacterium]|jgi:hypothetical protein|nr:hypothetical protein [Helicobacteraceae bacterium]
MDKARIYVDFNEMVTGDIMLLSKEDTKIDSDGNAVSFYEGMPVSIYSDDEESGKSDNPIADGIAIKYDLSRHPCWSHVKWCCKINAKGIYHESDIKEKTAAEKTEKDIIDKLQYIVSLIKTNGYPKSAEKLSDAIHYSSTGTELLMKAGNCLRSYIKESAAIENKELLILIEKALGEINVLLGEKFLWK